MCEGLGLIPGRGDTKGEEKKVIKEPWGLKPKQRGLTGMT